MKVGDLVQQRASGVAVISEHIKQMLNMDMVGVVLKVEESTHHSYDGRPRSDLTVQWSNGKVERLSEIYLEKLEKNT